MSVLGTNTLIREQLYSTGTNASLAAKTGTNYVTIPLNGTNHTGDRKTGFDICTFTKQSNNSYLLVDITFPAYLASGGAGTGVRMHHSTDDSTYYTDAHDDGPAHRWGMFGYGGNTSYTCRMMWDSRQLDFQRSSGITAHTGTWYFYFQTANWNATDTLYFLQYSASYPKYGTISVREYLA
jgi:hypothetical protein